MSETDYDRKAKALLEELSRPVEFASAEKALRILAEGRTPDAQLRRGLPFAGKMLDELTRRQLEIFRSALRRFVELTQRASKLTDRAANVAEAAIQVERGTRNANEFLVGVLGKVESPERLRDLVNGRRPPGEAPKEPSKTAIQCYRLHMAGHRATAIAEMLSAERKRKVHQGTVSRNIEKVRTYVEAGNILPDLKLDRVKATVRAVKPRELDYQDDPDGRHRPHKSPQQYDGDDE
jgi:hypothetical protein